MLPPLQLFQVFRCVVRRIRRALKQVTALSLLNLFSNKMAHLELIENRLIFTALTITELEDVEDIPCIRDFNLDLMFPKERFPWKGYNGPPRLTDILDACRQIDDELRHCKPEYRLIFYTNMYRDAAGMDKRTNSAFLMGAYAVLKLNWTPERFQRELRISKIPVTSFRDIHGSRGYGLNIEDSLLGLSRGVVYNGWFIDTETWRLKSEQTSLNGCANWIVPEKVLAFADPKDNSKSKDNLMHPVYSCVKKYFTRHRISTVVRLNEHDVFQSCAYGRPYDPTEFQEIGVNHYNIFIKDAGIPTKSNVGEFLQSVQDCEGAFGVHCHGGVGRTGTLISCYLIKNYNFSAAEAIAWLRICRPGSVMGKQQFFLESVQSTLRTITSNSQNLEKRSRGETDIKCVTVKGFVHAPETKTVVVTSEEIRTSRKDEHTICATSSRGASTKVSKIEETVLFEVEQDIIQEQKLKTTMETCYEDQDVSLCEQSKRITCRISPFQALQEARKLVHSFQRVLSSFRQKFVL